MKLTLKEFLLIGLFSLLLAGCAATGPETLSESSDGYTIHPEAESPDNSGMWLLPQIDGPLHDDLRSMGLQLTPNQIYSDGNASLNHAILRINVGEGGGGTGSFVSPEGLILTNHHVAYNGIAAASTGGQNYLETGFYANTLQDEIPLPNYTLYIPIEQTDVTGQIEAAIPDDADNRLRAEVKATVSAELVETRRDGNDDLIVEINDFWSGNRQYMSVYRIIRDVRTGICSGRGHWQIWR